jgi:hypothetical protein
MQGMFPMPITDHAWLFGHQRSVACLKRGFRDDCPSDPACGFFEGAWFHGHAPSWLRAVHTTLLVHSARSFQLLQLFQHFAYLCASDLDFLP